jgi:hypothetical protein
MCSEEDTRMPEEDAILDRGFKNAGLAYAMSIMENPRDLIPFLPHTCHFHGKFWQMTDDLHEYSIPCEEVLPVLIQAGWDGCMCSEYEGPRALLLASGQLRRRHATMRRVMGRA